MYTASPWHIPWLEWFVDTKNKFIVHFRFFQRFLSNKTLCVCFAATLQTDLYCSLKRSLIGKNMQHNTEYSQFSYTNVLSYSGIAHDHYILFFLEFNINIIVIEKQVVIVIYGLPTEQWYWPRQRKWMSRIRGYYPVAVNTTVKDQSFYHANDQSFNN